MAGNKDSTSQPGPPSYDTLYPPTPATSNTPGEDITAPRDGSPRLTLDPPLPQRTPFKTAEAAPKTALRGTAMAFQHTDPAVVAAQTACAIAVAVSTSRSYTAFVAAITAAESAALIFAESYHHHITEDHIFSAPRTQSVAPPKLLWQSMLVIRRPRVRLPTGVIVFDTSELRLLAYEAGRTPIAALTHSPLLLCRLQSTRRIQQLILCRKSSSSAA